MATEFPELPLLVQEIRDATDLEGALGALAGALDRGGFEPVNVSLTGVEADGKLRILGVWAAVPSRFEAGQIIAPEATRALLRNVERIRSGQPIRVHVDDEDLGLVGALAKEEGVAGWVVAPVTTPRGVSAMLSLASASREALDQIDLTRVHALATTLGHWMLPKPPRHAID